MAYKLVTAKYNVGEDTLVIFDGYLSDDGYIEEIGVRFVEWLGYDMPVDKIPEKILDFFMDDADFETLDWEV